jgi:hypothetical protein
MDSIQQEEPLRELPEEVAYFRDVWSKVHQPVPPRLSHYTDASGLSGIVRSGSLWATHIYYLNDSQEFRYGSQVIHEYFTGELASRPDHERDSLRLLHDCYRSQVALWESIADPYIVCFCQTANLLSQWRAYASVLSQKYV